MPCLLKRKEFEGEKEVRVFFKSTHLETPNVPWGVNLSVLVNEIVVDPVAPEWVVDLVESVIAIMILIYPLPVLR